MTDYTGISTQTSGQVAIDNLLAFESEEEIIAEIYAGLSAKQKKISSRFFYDQTGSLLFEKITALPEYYPTRTEKSILRKVAPRLMNPSGQMDIIELGSGDCSKISILLDAVPENKMEDVYYVPVDVSESAILRSAEILTCRYPDIRIHGLLADFMKHLTDFPGKGKRLIFFLGSTLGNISRHCAESFLKNLKSLMRPDDRFILGLDMVKNIATLEAAYNDDQGITDSFNKNILDVINAVAQTDFNPDLFEHEAFYNSDEARIEMHLRAVRDIGIHSPEFPQTIHLKEGETIHTENSHKFTDEDIQHFADLTDLAIENVFIDEKKWFSVVELRCIS